MERKASSPSASTPTFIVSAPGKVIVFGEHAAVFGEPAIAAAISLRSYLLVTTLSKFERAVKLNFRDIGLNHTWQIDALPWSIFHQPDRKKFYYSNINSLDPKLLQAIKPHADEVSKHLEENRRKMHVRSATAFLYLFLSLGSSHSPGFTYTLRSTIPIGAGLGSSASTCVCLSTALLLQMRTLDGPHPDQRPKEAQTQIELISRWAFVGELCIHGDPSGVDNAVSAGGKAIVYQKNKYGPPCITPLINFPKLPILLVHTQQSRSTAAQVDKVRALERNYPGVTRTILDGIGQLTRSALADLGRNEIPDMGCLGTMIRMNHGLLVSLGVSHPRLERIRELVDDADMGWTKLTGAGGGGCAITLLRPDTKSTTRTQLEETLTAENFQIYETTLGADGVAVLWPAVFRNDGDEGGDEIDQELFENAIGAEGIESLVGVGKREGQEGWKFWTQA